MKKKSKIIRILPLFILLVLAGGCYTKSGISKTEVFRDGEMNCIILQTRDSSWMIENYSVSEGILKGMIAPEGYKPDKKQIAFLYAAPPDAVSVDGKTISVLMDNIAKAEQTKINKARTFESLTLGVLVAIPLIFFLTLLIGGGYDM